ncbi:MAG: hypothetical protein HZC55_00420 [Verrucomicrobia bacterium]|nr:hypothetical protein [Verrucomicrobiota bacterium]
MTQKKRTYREVEIIETDRGFYVPLLERTFSSLADAHTAIDAYLTKPKEIVGETIDQPSIQQNGMPLLEPKPRQPGRRVRH